MKKTKQPNKKKSPNVDLKINIKSNPNEILLDLKLLRTNFPWLVKFADRRMREEHLQKGYAPHEVLVPKEFLFNPHKTKQEKCASEKDELIKRINKAFRRNNYSYHYQYKYLQRICDERSLYALNCEQLQKLLLDIVIKEC